MSDREKLLNDLRQRVAGFHFAQEQLTSGEKDILLVAELLLRWVDMERTEKTVELHFLRYFYEQVRPCLGPADSEIIGMIKKTFEKTTGQTLPAPYNEEE